jgi:hypothetical protein
MSPSEIILIPRPSPVIFSLMAVTQPRLRRLGTSTLPPSPPLTDTSNASFENH